MLIFDSGVGGLSVLKNIKKILPKVHYIYVLDNESFPYGNKTDIFIIQRSVKIIYKIKKIYPINIVVIACNTVSTIALSILREKFDIPIIGIFPPIQTAKKITKNKIIGLIATKATINSNYTKKIIIQHSLSNTIKIIGTNELALIAENKIRGIAVSKNKLKEIFKPWINLSIHPDTVILGCTHFLLLEKEIKKILCQKKSIHFINTTQTVIFQIENYFKKLQIKPIIKKNIFLYSKYNNHLRQLLFFLKEYQFQVKKYINLN